MFAQASSCIKVGNRLGQSFTTNVGLRQGDPLSPLLFNLFIADLIFAFKTDCDPPSLVDIPIPSIPFADDICNFSTSLQGIRNSINTTLQYCQANKLTVNISKSCYTAYNTSIANHQPIIIDGKALPYEAKSCYLGLCLSGSKYKLNSIMLKKASWAAFALSSATTVNKLFNQLIEPILLYGVEQWLPYIHPRKVAQVGLTETFAASNTQLSTEQIWKNMAYSHYSLHSTTPVLGVRSEMGQYPTNIPATIRLTKYLAYLLDSPNPIIQKAVLLQRTIAARSKFSWWSNAWRLVADFDVTEATISPLTPRALRMTSKAHIVGGGLNSWLFPPTCLNGGLSGNSTLPSTWPRTSTRAHRTSEPRPSVSVVPTITWMWNWVPTPTSLLNSEPVGSVTLEALAMSTMHFSVTNSWTSKSTTAYTLLPDLNSTQKCKLSSSIHKDTSQLLCPALNTSRILLSPYNTPFHTQSSHPIN